MIIKQEDKELLLRDLCARLPYGVIIQIKDWTVLDAELKIGHINRLQINDVELKPYLFPLSSMVEEQSKEYHELIGGMFGTSALINFEILEDFFHKNHFDYRGLIEKGLANDATGLNIFWIIIFYKNN